MLAVQKLADTKGKNAGAAVNPQCSSISWTELARRTMRFRPRTTKGSRLRDSFTHGVPAQARGSH
ncbi:hypothetical protein ACFOEY_06045 [Paracandidimonas soli]|uniref:hypothetical protein n=1 Tax=Paracandidimonas soli TaxID=1917182 RepID=UPI00361F7F77